MWSFIQRPNITINSFGCYTQVFFIMTTCLKRSQKLPPPSGRYAQVWLYNFIWSRTSLLKTCITMTNNKGFKAAPWWTSTFTEKAWWFPFDWNSSFTNLIWCHNPIYQIFWDTLLPQRKTNNLSLCITKSFFKIKGQKTASCWIQVFLHVLSE